MRLRKESPNHRGNNKSDCWPRARACEWKSAHRRSGRSSARSLGSSNTARGPSPSHRPRANISQSRDPGKKPCQREETSGDVILVWLFKQCTHTLSHTHRERQQCRPKEEEFLGVESARSGHQDAPGPVYKPSALNFIKLWLKFSSRVNFYLVKGLALV